MGLKPLKRVKGLYPKAKALGVYALIRLTIQTHRDTRNGQGGHRNRSIGRGSRSERARDPVATQAEGAATVGGGNGRATS